MDNQWEHIAKNYGLETYEGYKKVFLSHKHYSKDAAKRGQFYDGDSYVSMEKVIEALKLTEKAIKEKYNIKEDAES
jgi:hypothetical protein|tara:strand:- start:617 stop:844 length:228 start_codon:yes stop_codon:yes gene_type:complete